MVKEGRLYFTKYDIMQDWKFYHFRSFLLTTKIFQPAFVIRSDLKCVRLISCKIDQTVYLVSQYLIFQDNCVTLEGCPCMFIRIQLSCLCLTSSDTFGRLVYESYTGSQRLGYWSRSCKINIRHRRQMRLAFMDLPLFLVVAFSIFLIVHNFNIYVSWTCCHTGTSSPLDSVIDVVVTCTLQTAPHLMRHGTLDIFMSCCWHQTGNGKIQDMCLISMIQLEIHET